MHKSRPSRPQTCRSTHRRPDRAAKVAQVRPETTRLKKTIDAWWPAIATFIRTRATNSNTEAANVTVKNIKRTGRGLRCPIPSGCEVQ